MRVKDVHDILHGGPIPEFSPIRSTFVDVRDVAELVLRAVEKDSQAQSSRERYMLVGESPISPQKMADVLRASLPGRGDKIREGNPGETYPDMTWTFDASKAGTLLRRDWTRFQQSVVESAQIFLDAETTPPNKGT
jgi:nucleoside-diphosphate-sugar epimerase